MNKYSHDHPIIALDWSHGGFLGVLDQSGRLVWARVIHGDTCVSPGGMAVIHIASATHFACHPRARAIAVCTSRGVLLSHPGISASADLVADLGTPTRVAWSPDGEQLAVGTDRGAVVVIVGGDTTAVRQPWPREQAGDDCHRVRDLVWSRSGEHVAWTDSASVYVGPTRRLEPIRQYDVGMSPVIAWGPCLAIGAPGNQRIYMYGELDNRYESRRITTLPGIASLAWHGPDLAVGVWGGDWGVYSDEIWPDGDTSRRIFLEADAQTTRLAWSRCGKYLARVQGSRVVIDAVREMVPVS